MEITLPIKAIEEVVNVWNKAKTFVMVKKKGKDIQARLCVLDDGWDTIESQCNNHTTTC